MIIFIWSMESLYTYDTFLTPKFHCAITKKHFHIVITNQAGCNMDQHIKQCHGNLQFKAELPRYLYDEWQVSTYGINFLISKFQCAAITKFRFTHDIY